MTSPRPELAVFGLYGTLLGSDHRFANNVPVVAGEPELTFEYVDRLPAIDGAPSFSSPIRIDTGASFLDAFDRSDHAILRFNGVAVFEIHDDRIACQLLDPDYAHMVELHLLGFVMALWLERQGLPVLHAAAVVVGEVAIAFLAGNRAGKTSLAAAAMKAGHHLLSDDLVAVEASAEGVLARPGYPQMRMWPEEAARFVGPPDGLERVHPSLSKRRVPVGAGGFGSFCPQPKPLARIYLPERHPGAVLDITTLSAGTAVFEIVRRSFLHAIVEPLGLEVARFRRIGRIVSSVPVRRVVYPAGFDYIADVVAAIAADARDQ